MKKFIPTHDLPETKTLKPLIDKWLKETYGDLSHRYSDAYTSPLWVPTDVASERTPKTAQAVHKAVLTSFLTHSGLELRKDHTIKSKQFAVELKGYKNVCISIGPLRKMSYLIYIAIEKISEMNEDIARAAKEKAEHAEKVKLRASAKAKLSKEEWEAVCS